MSMGRSSVVAMRSAMKAAGTGSIINISCRSGLVGVPGAPAYASCKAAIRNHSRTDGRALLRATRLEDTLQLGSPGRHPNADPGA
jgi:NADP-dependent 3-hydroxy acid dehydrogenase YdfG